MNEKIWKWYFIFIEVDDLFLNIFPRCMVGTCLITYQSQRIKSGTCIPIN